MNKYCTGSRASGSGSRAKIIGILLMAAGVLVMLFFVPGWLLTGVLSILLISLGFLIWRFAA